jgi:hypothetical protein
MPRGSFEPVLVRTRAAAGGVLFASQVRVRLDEATLHRGKPFCGIHLHSRVIVAVTTRGPAREGKIDTRIINHPLGIVWFVDIRETAEHRVVAPDAGCEISHCDMDVREFHGFAPVVPGLD